MPDEPIDTPTEQAPTTPAPANEAVHVVTSWVGNEAVNTTFDYGALSARLNELYGRLDGDGVTVQIPTPVAPTPPTQDELRAKSKYNLRRGQKVVALKDQMSMASSARKSYVAMTAGQTYEVIKYEQGWGYFGIYVYDNRGKKFYVNETAVEPVKLVRNLPAWW